MVQPQLIPQKLSGNPIQPPKFSVEGKLKSGEKIQLADPKATRALVALMDMYAVLGGAASHYGGPAAFAELISAAHGLIFHEAQKQKKSWFDLFHFINDAGHCENGIYALKANYQLAGLNLEALKGFRSITSPLTGHGESHLFPEGVYLSNGPLGSALPQAQGLALAEKLSGQNRTTMVAISDGACMEGEAREALAAIPGLAQKGKLSAFVMMISDNNTKLSGRIDQDSYSMAPTFAALESLGWQVFSLEEGNDLQKCLETLEAAIHQAQKNPQKPIAIHAKTVKGIGTKKTAESASGGHGFPCKNSEELKKFVEEIYSGAEVPKEFNSWFEELQKIEAKQKSTAVKPSHPEEKIQVGVSSAMSKARKAGLPILSVTSDLPGSTGVAGFRKDFPEASIDVGVAESNMISVAAGLSKQGFIPVVDTFAQFGVTKGALPMTMASLSQAPIVGIFSHTGFQDAADGASHQALSYYAMAASIPFVRVFALTCSEEADHLVYEGLQKFAEERSRGEVPDSLIFFLGRENFPKSFQHLGPQSYRLDRANVVLKKTQAPNRTITIVAAGSMLVHAAAAAEELIKQNIGVILINPVCLNQVDITTMKEVLPLSANQVLFVEDHQRIGGFHQTWVTEIVGQQIPISFKALAVEGEFGQSAYNSIELYDKHGLGPTGIIRATKELLKL